MNVSCPTLPNRLLEDRSKMFATAAGYFQC